MKLERARIDAYHPSDRGWLAYLYQFHTPSLTIVKLERVRIDANHP